MKSAELVIVAVVNLACAGMTQVVKAQKADAVIHPARLARIASVDERFQSYNIEMVEVTGGRFWKPYDSAALSAPAEGNQPAGMSASLYEYRRPIDLTNPRLRKLAAALGPAYVRVSGTWANTTWFQNDEGPAKEAPPAGFKGVLTRQQWKGVIDFSNAVGAPIVTSFAVGDGVRDDKGVWTAEQARQLLAFTHSAGGKIAAAEFMNEPTVPQMGGAPKGYDAAAYAKDFAVFRAFVRQQDPKLILLGPGGVGEGSPLMPASMKIVHSEEILTATGPVFDAFSYHSYGAVSRRCAPEGQPGSASADGALSAELLDKSAGIEKYYAAIRDRFEPGKPIWLTETAQAACGGDRWAATFLDSFRYLDQLGSLSRRGVKVHMHNTLGASDYGLLDEKSYEPRPNYWAALLWHKFMGAGVLDAGSSASLAVRLYAHCLPDGRGGVMVLAINTDAKAEQTIDLADASDRFTLTAPSITAKNVLLNGTELALGPDDSLPSLNGQKSLAGVEKLSPASITFFVLKAAKNKNCVR